MWTAHRQQATVTAVKRPQGVTPGEHRLVYPQAWTLDGPGAMSAWPLLPAALPTRGHTAA